MNWLDYVLVFLFIYCLYKGFKQGLVQQVIGLANFFIAFFLALTFSSYVFGWMEKYLRLDTVISSLAEDGDTPIWLFEVLINIIAFLLAFLIISFILSLVTSRLKLVNKIPLIGPVNAISGGAMGVAKGILLVFLVVGVVSLIETSFWINSLEASAIVALSYHYMTALFQFIVGSIVDSLGIIV